MKVKNVISTLFSTLAIILVIVIIAGCGKTENTQNQNKKQDSVNTQNKTDNQNQTQNQNKTQDQSQNPGIDPENSKIKENLENQKKEVMKTTDSPDNPAAAIAVVRIPSAGCDKCKDIITDALKKVDGVGEFTIDINRKVAKIKFDMSKTDISKIESAISSVGFDANEKKADPEAYKKLDECCKQPGAKK